MAYTKVTRKMNTGKAATNTGKATMNTGKSAPSKTNKRKLPTRPRPKKRPLFLRENFIMPDKTKKSAPVNPTSVNKRKVPTQPRPKKRVRFDVPDKVKFDVPEEINVASKKRGATTKRVNVDVMDVEQPQVVHPKQQPRRDAHSRRNAKNYVIPCKKVQQGTDKYLCEETGKIINTLAKKYKNIIPYEPYKYKNSVKRRVNILLKSNAPNAPRTEWDAITYVINDNLTRINNEKSKSLTALVNHNNKMINYVAKESKGERQVQKQCEKNLQSTNPELVNKCMKKVRWFKANFKGCPHSTHHIVAPTCRKNPNTK